MVLTAYFYFCMFRAGAQQLEQSSEQARIPLSQRRAVMDVNHLAVCSFFKPRLHRAGTTQHNRSNRAQSVSPQLSLKLPLLVTATVSFSPSEFSLADFHLVKVAVIYITQIVNRKFISTH